MARLSIVALFALALAGVTSANLQEQQRLVPTDTPIRTTAGWDWADCGLPTDPVQIESISVTPDPPKPGEDLTVNVKAIVVEDVAEGAYADVVVKLGLVQLLKKRFDVCEEARNANASVQCPVSAGPYDITQTVALPREIPQAKFTVAVRGYTAEEDDMLCLNLKVDFMKKPFFRWGN
ncbi:hypothetical protein JAAARDRAFT_148241 [Jaapia argillacea MUCL 33604]|uniref:Phosphatidylglycerol/phosphatidylinositol transfer protein n=1 Tax=Jaapia argillacea MUCL 33604 TaxID=933084 RepID=A0A067QBW4_9AGAM|nr:hypothetical protein JAAARDRAFT_148241 [Jaapia argillacea MUCL 33604]